MTITSTRGIPVTLTPGEIITMPGFGDILIVSPHSHEVAFAAGTSLYVQDAPSFLDDLVLGAVAAGSLRAEEWVTVSRLLMEFVMAAGPRIPYLLVSIVKVWVWYINNKEVIHHAIRWSDELLEIRRVLRERFPHTYEFLTREILRQAIESFEFDFQADDAATLLGTLFGRGLELGFLKAASTLWDLVGAASTVAVRTAFAAGPAAARGTAANVADRGQRLATALRDACISISAEDAERLAEELDDPQARDTLQRLQQACYALSRDLEALQASAAVQ